MVARLRVGFSSPSCFPLPLFLRFTARGEAQAAGPTGPCSVPPLPLNSWGAGFRNHLKHYIQHPPCTTVHWTTFRLTHCRARFSLRDVHKLSDLHDFGKSRVCCHKQCPDNMGQLLNSTRGVVPRLAEHGKSSHTSTPEGLVRLLSG